MEISFFVPGIPKGAGSKSAFPLKKWLERICPKCGHRWQVKDFFGKVAVQDSSGEAGKEWRANVTTAAFTAMKEAGLAPLEGPLFVSIDFFLPRPKAHWNSKGELKSPIPTWHEKQPDVLKLGRAVEDAMTGIVYRDDSQISVERLKKSYPITEGTGCRVYTEQLKLVE